MLLFMSFGICRIVSKRVEEFAEEVKMEFHNL